MSRVSATEVASKRNFFHQEPDFFKISRFRLIAGIATGLLFSFVFYSFLYLLRETLRILTVTENYDLWVLTDQQVHESNFIFALIAVVLAQSFTIAFMIDRPKRAYEKHNLRRTSIINDQRDLNWYFLFWFLKLSFLIAFFMNVYQGGFYVFTYELNFHYILVLIIIVLFLQTWNTISVTFKRNIFKRMGLSVVILCAVAFGLSRIDLVDYNAINRKVLQKNILCRYNIELPECEKSDWTPYSDVNIYIAGQKDSTKKSQPVIIINNKEVKPGELKQGIGDMSYYDREYYPFLHYRLNIHKDIKVSFVDSIINELRNIGIRKFSFAVVPFKRKYDVRYYRDNSIRVPRRDTIEIQDPSLKTAGPGIQHEGILIRQEGSAYEIDGTRISTIELKSKLQTVLQDNPHTLMLFEVDDTTVFSDYITLLSSARAAVDELRDIYSMAKYTKQFESLNLDEITEVMEKYPFYFYTGSVPVRYKL